MSLHRRILAITTASVLLLTGCSAANNGDNGSDDKVLVIGVAGGLTGDAAVGDVPMLAGVKFAVDKINSAGGVGGFTLKVISQDMQSNSTMGGTVAQELVDQGAHVLVGPAFPGMASGVLQVAAANSIPVIAGASTQPEYTLMSSAAVFLAAFGDNVQAAAVAQYVLGEGLKRAFVVSSPDMTYTGNGADFFADAFKHEGGTVVGKATYSIGQTDFSAQVTAIANNGEPIDVIYSPMFPPDLPSFVRALRSAGVTTPVVGPDGYHTAEVLAAGQDAFDGTVFATHGFDVPGSDFAAFVVEGTKFDPTVADGPAIAALGYTTVQIIEAALKAAGSIDPAAITDALKKIESLSTVTGEITYAGTNGVPKKSVTIGGVVNGEFVYLDSFVPKYIPTP